MSMKPSQLCAATKNSPDTPILITFKAVADHSLPSGLILSKNDLLEKFKLSLLLEIF